MTLTAEAPFARARPSQSGLARLSGVRRPSISGFLSSKVDLSDDDLDRLLSRMGCSLKVVRRPDVPQLTRSGRRSWHLHLSTSPGATVVGSQGILGTYDESQLPAAATMLVEVAILPIAKTYEETARLSDRGVLPRSSASPGSGSLGTLGR